MAIDPDAPDSDFILPFKPEPEDEPRAEAAPAGHSAIITPGDEPDREYTLKFVPPPAPLPPAPRRVLPYANPTTPSPMKRD